MQEEWSSGRMWRLCQKELRETLSRSPHDYHARPDAFAGPNPLLSAALQRFLLTSFSGNTEAKSYWIGASSEAEGAALLDAIRGGQYLLQQRPYHRSRSIDCSTKNRKPPRTLRNWSGRPDVPKFEVKIVTGDPLAVLADRAVELIASATPLTGDKTPTGQLQPFAFECTIDKGTRKARQRSTNCNGCSR